MASTCLNRKLLLAGMEANETKHRQAKTTDAKITNFILLEKNKKLLLGVFAQLQLFPNCHWQIFIEVFANWSYFLIMTCFFFFKFIAFILFQNAFNTKKKQFVIS